MTHVKSQQKILQYSGRPLDKGATDSELKIEPSPICLELERLAQHKKVVHQENTWKTPQHLENFKKWIYVQKLVIRTTFYYFEVWANPYSSL